MQRAVQKPPIRSGGNREILLAIMATQYLAKDFCLKRFISGVGVHFTGVKVVWIQ